MSSDLADFMSPPVERIERPPLGMHSRVEGELLGWRWGVKRVLTHRFGPLPEEFVRQIDGLSDLDRLKAAFVRAIDAPQLGDWQL